MSGFTLVKDRHGVAARVQADNFGAKVIAFDGVYLYTNYGTAAMFYPYLNEGVIRILHTYTISDRTQCNILSIRIAGFML